MKNLKVFIYLFVATGLVLVSCSKDSNKELEASVNESTQLITATDAQQAPDLAKIEAELLNFDKTVAFKESAKNETATSRNSLPSRVQSTIDREYPDALMVSFEEYISIPNRSYKHYSVFLNNGMEIVVFQWGHLLANATIETEYELTELKGGELDWDILLRLYYNYTSNEKVIEEIEPSSQVGLFDIDFKDGSRIVVNSSGQIVATGIDTDGDDDEDGTGLPTLPGGDDSDSSGNTDDDDDGLGDNDDGVAGNNDDDDDGNGDNDDGISSNNDDDDDGLGDNDDGIVGNSDDDDDGNGDNDDGISNNSDNDDNGNGDNDDGVSGNGTNIAPSSLPASIQNYIATNYPAATITKAEQYANKYEVNLSTGVELYFDLNGNLIGTSGNNGDDDDDNGHNGGDDDDDGFGGNDDDGLGDNDDGNGDNDDGVSGNGNTIAPSSLPAAIQNYIATNYPTATITKAEQYTNRYEVNLNTGVELYFDLNGNLIGTSGNNGDDDDDNGNNGGDDDDDGINGNNDDDDDGIGSGNNDDDDDGLGDNDDGIAGNQDNDDNGNGDNDDGVSGNGNTIAPSSLPAAIQNYIATNYPTATITKAEQYTSRYEVNLSTGIELYFDLNGNLLGTSGNNGGDDDDDGPSDDDDDGTGNDDDDN